MYLKRIHFNFAQISENLVKLKSNFVDNGGEWNKFKLGDLFEVRSSKKIFHANQIKQIYKEQQEYTFPYVVRSALNNGIKGYINENKDFLNPPNTLSFAQDTFSVFYQDKPYFTGNKVKVLIPKFKHFNKTTALFIVTIYQKILAHLTWGTNSTTKDIEEINLKLPTIDNEIAFDFMEKYIKELEAERIKELEAYLKVTGLNNYELNEKEIQALQDFTEGGGKLNYKEMKIGDLFESENGDFDIQKTHLNDKGYYVVSSGIENCGIIGKTDIKSKIFPRHTITCDMFGNVFYRDFKYKTVTHARVFSLEFLNKNFNKKSALYILATMNYLKYKFSYSNMCSFKKIKDIFILLPTQEGQIAFDFMENFISAVQKEVIKSVVLWNEKRINATKDLVK